MGPKPLRVLLQGGTGNQLMQLVFARFAAEKTERKAIVYKTLLESNLRNTRGVTNRNLSTIIPKISIIGKTPFHKWIFARLLRRLSIFKSLVISDRGLVKTDIVNVVHQGKDAEFIITHATSPELFSSRFRSLWKEVYDELPKSMSPTSFGLHIRRGDYLKGTSGFVSLPLDYYRRAIEHVFEQLPNLERRIMLFSDDPGWGQVNLKDSRWELEIASGTPEEDLAAMAAMRALVISNSSLSAVAAHLGESFGQLQLVICPNQWLSNPERKALGDLRKPSWISLPIQA